MASHLRSSSQSSAPLLGQTLSMRSNDGQYLFIAGTTDLTTNGRPSTSLGGPLGHSAHAAVDADVSLSVLQRIRERAPVRSLLLALLYFILTVTMPLFNNIVFKGWAMLHVEGFPYPLVATWLQMLGASLTLLLVDALVHKFPGCCRVGANVPRRRKEERSWVFQSDFRALRTKLQHLIPVAIAFAAVMGLTNVGLSQIALNVHVLLRSSEIIWIVAFAWPIQGERPSWMEAVCVVVMIAGTVMLSVDWGRHDIESFSIKNLWPLIINLGSTVASGLMIVLLRRACVQLQARDATISVVEITTIKMSLATLLILPFSLALEMDGWRALSSASDTIVFLVFGGVIMTMLYQTVVVALTAFTLATSVGILAQTKVVPQVLLSILLFHEFIPSLLRILGLILIVVASVAYGVLRYLLHRRAMKLRELTNFQAIVREDDEYSQDTDGLDY